MPGPDLGVEPGARALLAALPFAVMAVVAAVDVLAGPRVGFLPLLSLGPALAAVAQRPPVTAVIGGVAMMLCTMLSVYDDLLTSRRALIALATVVGVTAAGVIASAGRQRRERELANVRAVADMAQRVLLRPVPGQAGELRLAVRYMSAAASARIGGDLYEAVPARGGLRLIVADVQGKGLAAVQTAAVVLGAFREAAHDAADLVTIADRIETSLLRHESEEEFVTAVLAQASADGASIEVLSCGHPPPLLIGGKGARFAEPPDAGLPLGLGQIAAAPRLPYLLPFGPGEQVLFYTDGITEARDRAGAFYSLERCQHLLAGYEPGEALRRLCADVVGHVGHALHDDAAMLLMSRQPAPAPAAMAAVPAGPCGPGPHGVLTPAPGA